MSSSGTHPDDWRALERKVKQMLESKTKQASKVKRQQEYLKRCLSLRPWRAKLGDIPANILNTGTSIKSNGTLSCLPTELQHMLFGYLAIPDLATLALTSKENASKVTFFKIREAAKTNARSKAISKEVRIGVLIAIRDFMPPNLRLCCVCGTYRLKACQSYEAKPGWGGIVNPDWRGMTARKAMAEGPRCSACNQRETCARSKWTVEFKQFERAVAGLQAK